MSRTPIRFAELHAPLFSRTEGQHGQGVNLGMKLDPHHRVGLKLEFDEDNHSLYVTFSGVTSRVPETNVVTMIEGEVKTAKLAAAEVQKTGANPATAQVETPQSHVFAGEGKGKTGRG